VPRSKNSHSDEKDAFFGLDTQITSFEYIPPNMSVSVVTSEIKDSVDFLLSLPRGTNST
jgi:hypothetical protein